MTRAPHRRAFLSWIDRWLPAGVLAEDAKERMRQRLLAAFGLLVLALTVPWYVWMLVEDPVLRVPRTVALAALTLLAANPLWLRFASPRAVAWTTVALLHLAFLFPVLMNEGLGGPAVPLISSLPVITAVLLGSRFGWADMAAIVVFGGVLERLASAGILPRTAPEEIWPLIRIMTLTLSIGFMLLAVTAYAELSHRQARELAAARDDALAASRAKTRFLSVMSHELRTPMVGVIGATDLLGRTEVTPAQQELIALLQRSASSQLELIGNVLDLARVEADHFELEKQTVAPRKVLAEVEALFQVAARTKGLELKVDFDPDTPPWIVADALRLRQVLSNLLGNAIKFTERGSITLSVRRAGDARDPRLRFVVEDTGIGFDPERSEELFDAFRQADGSTMRRFGGSGLGLSICRRLIEAMGGTIAATSAPGRGSAFRFEIPTPLAEPPAVEDEALDPASGRSLAVLLADDDPVNRYVLSAMLEELGHRSLEAADGRVALTLAETQPVDLVILDMHMPELDGPACARALRCTPGPASKVPILGLTADAIVDNHEGYLASGIDAVYTKPIDLEQLRRAIARVVAGSGAGGPPGETPHRAGAAADAEGLKA